MSKELENILNAINKYIEKHDRNVLLTFSIMAFEGEDFKVIDDSIGCYGDKKSLLIDLEEITKAVKKKRKISLIGETK